MVRQLLLLPLRDQKNARLLKNRSKNAQINAFVERGPDGVAAFEVQTLMVNHAPIQLARARGRMSCDAYGRSQCAETVLRL
eukprot:SAG31_NODE_2217_length_6168_cov_10.730598_4_plen_81_part_00